MKIKNIITIIFMICLSMKSFSQNKKGILYKSNQWLNIKEKGHLFKAMESPVYENVEILRTDKYIKVTLGKKILNYQIVSTSIIGTKVTKYNVKLNEENYEIGIGDFGEFVNINIEGNWFVQNITNIDLVDVK